MKKNYLNRFVYAAGFLLFLSAGCNKSDIRNPIQSSQQSDQQQLNLQGYEMVRLVANRPLYNARLIDHHLRNAWGIAANPHGPIWISANHTGVSTVYDTIGNTLLSPVNIPAADSLSPGEPTGLIYNSTSDFMIGGTKASIFIFAGEDGTISAWPAGATAATLTASRAQHGAVYKGLALANDGGNNFLYVTNFSKGKIDVLNKNFKYVQGKPFLDTAIPKGYAPFNIRNINGNLYVTYAFQKSDHMDDSAGVGRGYVDIFTPAGALVKRFASNGKLNSPWGIVNAKSAFTSVPNAILIGNFGDGHINVFNGDGSFRGQLKDKNGHVITIDGLWGIENNIPGINPNRLYFTAGPAGEDDGLFGYLFIQ